MVKTKRTIGVDFHNNYRLWHIQNPKELLKEIEIPSQFLSSLPYLATIIVLVVISRNVNTIRLNSPASLGQPYRPDA